MEIDYEELEKQIKMIPPQIGYELQREMENRLKKCGLYYRMFSRTKGASSVVKKMKKKQYNSTKKKMQDLIGVRVALYFRDDVDICVELIKQQYQVVEITRDAKTSDKFSPIRLNIVCKMPDIISNRFEQELWSFPIDKTFEVQIRTVFSEGWHEVEHDLRYKNQDDWAEHMELSRSLNGIFAALELCDRSILNVLDELAYNKYKSGDWNAMLRNHLRLRLDNDQLSPNLTQLFTENQQLAKDFYKVNRDKLLLLLGNENMCTFPMRMDNIVYIINEFIVHNSEISALVPAAFISRINKSKEIMGQV